MDGKVLGNVAMVTIRIMLYLTVSFSGSFGFANATTGDRPFRFVGSSSALEGESAHAPETECDRQAASNVDEMRIASVAGTTMQEVDGPIAARACLNDLQHYPNETRLWFQLGRALDVMGLHDEAFDVYCRAAASGSAAAMNNLAILYEYGRGITTDTEAAKQWFAKSAEGRNRYGVLNAARAFNRYGNTPEDGSASARWYLEAVRLQDREAIADLERFDELNLETKKSLGMQLMARGEQVMSAGLPERDVEGAIRTVIERLRP